MEIGQPSREASNEAIIQVASQISQRYKEIKILKIENQKLVEIIKKKEEEIKLFENKSKELLDINDKLAERLLGQLPLQGARHLLWDMIITEAKKKNLFELYQR